MKFCDPIEHCVLCGVERLQHGCGVGVTNAFLKIALPTSYILQIELDTIIMVQLKYQRYQEKLIKSTNLIENLKVPLCSILNVKHWNDLLFLNYWRIISIKVGYKMNGIHEQRLVDEFLKIEFITYLLILFLE